MEKRAMLPIQIQLPENYLCEETRDGYKISSQSKELFAVLLDLLNQVQLLCEKHNIQYFADSGTLLGAVRHKGFIPWDDDIDLMMTRENFEKFSFFAKKELKAPYFFQDEFNEKGSLRLMGKVFNSNTTSILTIEKHRHFKFNQGIFLDIICFDNMPDDSQEKTEFVQKTDALRVKAKKLNCLTYRYNPSDDRFSVKKIFKVFFKLVYTTLHLKNIFFIKLNKYCQTYNKLNTQEIGSVLYKGKREPPQLKSDYAKSENVPFEFMTINIPAGYENILNRQYGEWKQFEVGTSAHGGLIIDTRKSYKEYMKGDK